jgi:ABC-type transport system involved in multi-copper enzyme maturation permease subunit
MTVRTMDAQPGQNSGAQPRPVPWRGVLWVTWRQHRGLLISVSATFIVAVIVMVCAGFKIHHDYATLMACRPAASPACQQLINQFNVDWHLGNGIRVAMLAAPVLLAMLAGPPVLARELETGTFRYAWTQGIGRVRWTVAKLVFLGSVVTIAALLITPLFTWLFVPFFATQNLKILDAAVFATHGTDYAAWMLTAFCLGAFLGMLVRRILPAMAATLGSYLALAALTWFCLRNHYPVSTFWPMQLFEAGWLTVLSVLLIAGTVWLVRRHAT